MKHLKKGRKLGRKKKQRGALLAILVGELLDRGKILTTAAKAKETRILAEKMLTRARGLSLADRSGNVSSIRLLRKHLPAKISAARISEISKTLAGKKSGFIRLVKTGNRRSDGAETALLEIISN